ncbi:MAG TPA: pilin [Candidatus Limnocylindria bacterium]|nr:pilin [Candidatus Limnocylindria bacterium]
MKKLKTTVLHLTSLLVVVAALSGAVLQFAPAPKASAQRGAAPCTAAQWNIGGTCYGIPPCSPGNVNYGSRGCISDAEAQAEVDRIGPVDGAEEPQRQARNTCNQAPLNADNCPFLANYVVPFINALSGAVGILVVIMIAWSGIQYASAKDNPQQAAAAKEHIRNALLALVIYIFMVAFLNWVVPGGVF